jgi:hypothetical protein
MKTSHLLLLGFCLAVASCRKVDIEPQEHCEPLPLSSNPTVGWNYQFESFHVRGPFFNPNNGDEILFVRRGEDGSGWRIVKYAIASKTAIDLYSGKVGSVPSWGKNHWVLFGTSDGDIFKIKDSGDSLTQLTWTGWNWDPSWNPEGTQYAYRSNASGKDTTYIFSSTGVPLDTLSESGIGLTWSHSRYSPDPAGEFLNISDMFSDTVIHLVNSPTDAGGSSGYGAVFTGDNDLVYSYQTGIYSIDIHSRKVKQIRASCNSIRYRNAAYSSILMKLLWVKMVYEPLGGNDILVKTRLVLMDVDGSNEEEIEVH